MFGDFSYPVFAASNDDISNACIDDDFINSDEQFDKFAVEVRQLLADEGKVSEKSEDFQNTEKDSETENEKFDMRRLIVKSYDEISDKTAKCHISGYGNLNVFQYNTVEETIAAYEKFLEMKNVEYVETDEKVELSISGDSMPDSYQKASSSVAGSDDMADNWGISKMNFASYYSFLDEYEVDRQEVIVAVIDTGLNEDVSSVFNNRVVGGESFTYVDTMFKRENNMSYYADENGHGTAVCGVIAQATDENVKIMPIKCLDAEGEGSDLAVYLGIVDALNNGADVINMSCCAEGESLLYNEALGIAHDMEVCVVVASGNEYQDVANVTPACIPSAITVSSIDKNNNFSSFSNYGKYIDVAAPGELVSLTYYKGGTVVNSGTSFSAPLISSAVACLLECNQHLKPDEIETLFKLNAVDLGDAGWDKYYGYGWIDMHLLENDMLQYIIKADGDANNDGQVDITDVLYILKAVVGDVYMDDLQRAKIGVYGDLAVTSSHALAVMRIVVGINTVYIY